MVRIFMHLAKIPRRKLHGSYMLGMIIGDFMSGLDCKRDIQRADVTCPIYVRC